MIGSILLTSISIVLINGCAKDGAPGAQGPQGTAGTNGTDGTDGNANVIGTNTVTTSSWIASGTSWTTTFTAAGITQNVVDKGIVQVFIQYGSSWWALPDLSGNNSTSFGFSLGEVTLLNSNSNGSQATNPGVQTFRVVIITASNLIAHPNVDFKNYSEIKSTFNLPD